MESQNEQPTDSTTPEEKKPVECQHTETEVRTGYVFDTVHCVKCGKQTGIY